MLTCAILYSCNVRTVLFFKWVSLLVRLQNYNRLQRERERKWEWWPFRLHADIQKRKVAGCLQDSHKCDIAFALPKWPSFIRASLLTLGIADHKHTNTYVPRSKNGKRMRRSCREQKAFRNITRLGRIEGFSLFDPRWWYLEVRGSFLCSTWLFP